MAVDKILLLLCCGLSTVLSQTSIPLDLRECYANNASMVVPLPLNLPVLVDILRKVERYTYSTMDMKTLSTSLLRRFKFDGIKYHPEVPADYGILPYSGTGPQRTKHRLIEELVPGNADLFPDDVLSHEERCILHRAISNTVMTFSMPNADRDCNQIGQTERITGRTILTGLWNCPREHGVIHTSYGTVALGVVIETIAASLQRQNIAINQLLAVDDTTSGFQDLQDFQYNEEEVDLIVPKKEMIEERSMWHHSLMSSLTKLDSVWLTSIAGELAEMVVYQGPLVNSDMVLGATGFWNSTMLPTLYYLTGDTDNFDATRAELVGGIDGLILANNLETWLQDFYSLRLSQVLDMYYSPNGIAFNPSVRACSRNTNYPTAIPKTILTDQTFAISQLLAYRKSVAYVTPEALQRMVGYAVDKFSSYTQHLFAELPCTGRKHVPRVEALIAFDGSWSMEYTVDFMSVLIQDLDVSMYGSKMGILHGTTGEWLVNVTNSPSTVFHSLRNFSDITWPTHFDYAKTLSTILEYLDRTWEENQKNHVIGNLGQVVVLLIPLAHMSDTEKESALMLLRKIKDQHPEVSFVYYTSRYNANLFKSFVISEEDHMIKNSNIDAIVQYLSKVPRILRPTIGLQPGVTADPVPEVEGYISTTETITYRFHPTWRRNTKKILMRIHTYGYGTMNLCSWNEFSANGQKISLHCRELTGHGDVELTDHFKCTEDNSCPDTYYQLQNATSLYRCAEIDCKTPDQIRYIIRTEQVFFSGATGTHNLQLHSVNVVFLFILQTLVMYLIS